MRMAVRYSRYARAWWAGILQPYGEGTRVTDIQYYPTWREAMNDAIQRLS